MTLTTDSPFPRVDIVDREGVEEPGGHAGTHSARWKVRYCSSKR